MVILQKCICCLKDKHPNYAFLGTRKTCKTCDSIFPRECTRCKIKKDFSNFAYSYHRPSKGYHLSVCKECTKQRLYQRRRQSKDLNLCIRCNQQSLQFSLYFCRVCWFKQKSLKFFGNKNRGLDLENLAEQQNYQCIYSREKLIPSYNMVLDYRISLKLGGSNTIDNLQWLSISAYLCKANQSHEDFLKRIENRNLFNL